MTLAGTCRPYITHNLVSKNVLTTSEVLHVPWGTAMHVADISMSFCKLCKLLLREEVATELAAEFGLWNSLALAGFTQDIMGCVLGGGASFSSARQFVFSWERLTDCGDFLVVGRG